MRPINGTIHVPRLFAWSRQLCAGDQVLRAIGNSGGSDDFFNGNMGTGGLLTANCDMKRTNQITKSALVAGIMIMLLASCGAQDANSNASQPHFAGQAPGEKQALLHQMKGTVSVMDKQKMTLTVKLAEGNRTFKLTAKTKFTRNAAPAAMTDVAAGQPVQVVVKAVFGQPDEIVSVDIKSQ